jgi:hypothetical protein
VLTGDGFLTTAYTDAELEFLKGRLFIQFGAAPRLADGVILKTWKSGPDKGKPRLPQAIQSLIERGMMSVVTPARSFPVAKFTAIGLQALQVALRSGRDDERFAHLVAELSSTVEGHEVTGR